MWQQLSSRHRTWTQSLNSFSVNKHHPGLHLERSETGWARSPTASRTPYLLLQSWEFSWTPMLLWRFGRSASCMAQAYCGDLEVKNAVVSLIFPLWLWMCLAHFHRGTNQVCKAATFQYLHKDLCHVHLIPPPGLLWSPICDTHWTLKCMGGKVSGPSLDQGSRIFLPMFSPLVLQRDILETRRLLREVLEGFFFFFWVVSF